MFVEFPFRYYLKELKAINDTWVVNALSNVKKVASCSQTVFSHSKQQDHQTFVARSSLCHHSPNIPSKRIIMFQIEKKNILKINCFTLQGLVPSHSPHSTEQWSPKAILIKVFRPEAFHFIAHASGKSSRSWKERSHLAVFNSLNIPYSF